MRWEDDLFGPADQDNRTTTDVEQFFAAQKHWLETTLPENGVILEPDPYGTPKLPPRAERVWGKPRKSDKIGLYVDGRTGEVQEVPFRIIEREPAVGGTVTAGDDGPDRPKASRPEISSKGVEQIGDLRTDALHQGLREAPLNDTTLLGLLVLALGAQNVSAQSAADPAIAPRFRTYGTGGARAEIARRLIEGGHLTSDRELLHAAARDMLVQVLSCRVGMSQSGVVARVAGDAIGADAFLPSMAEDDFLKTLSKGGIEKAIRELGLAPRNTGKDMRAALIEHVGRGRYALPAAHFGLQATELSELHDRVVADRSAEPTGEGDESIDDSVDSTDGLDSSDEPDIRAAA